MRKRLAWRVAGSLLLTTILVMVGYYWFVVGPREQAFAELQRRVQSWGGQVYLDQPFSPRLARLRSWIGNELTLRIGGNEGVAVGVNGIEATKEQLADLLTASPIRRVSLGGSRNLDDDWIAGINPTSSMFHLSIGGTGVTDRSVPKILEMRGLNALDLADTAISDSSVELLRNLPELRLLCVGGPNIKAVRLVDAGVFDGSGRQAVETGTKLHARGTVKISGLSRQLRVVRVIVRTPGDQPAWKSLPYGRNAGVELVGELVPQSTDSWSFQVDLPSIPSGKFSVEIWVEESISRRKAIFYRLEPFELALAPLAEVPK
jgi:hypothetical protein